MDSIKMLLTRKQVGRLQTFEPLTILYMYSR